MEIDKKQIIGKYITTIKGRDHLFGSLLKPINEFIKNETSLKLSKNTPKGDNKEISYCLQIPLKDCKNIDDITVQDFFKLNEIKSSLLEQIKNLKISKLSKFKCFPADSPALILDPKYPRTPVIGTVYVAYGN